MRDEGSDWHRRLVEIDVERYFVHCSRRVREVVAPLKEGSGLVNDNFSGAVLCPNKVVYKVKSW